MYRMTTYFCKDKSLSQIGGQPLKRAFINEVKKQNDG